MYYLNSLLHFILIAIFFLFAWFLIILIIWSNVLKTLNTIKKLNQSLIRKTYRINQSFPLFFFYINTNKFLSFSSKSKESSWFAMRFVSITKHQQFRTKSAHFFINCKENYAKIATKIWLISLIHVGKKKHLNLLCFNTRPFKFKVSFIGRARVLSFATRSFNSKLALLVVPEYCHLRPCCFTLPRSVSLYFFICIAH